MNKAKLCVWGQRIEDCNKIYSDNFYSILSRLVERQRILFVNGWREDSLQMERDKEKNVYVYWESIRVKERIHLGFWLFLWWEEEIKKQKQNKDAE